MSQARTAKERVCFSRTQKHPLKENKRITCGNRKKAKEVRVLAERNPAVAAVGVWVECGDDGQEHPAVQALLTEERLEETRREKEESLRKFQDAVRERVSQQARLRKQQQLLKSYQMVECESKVLQTSKSVHRLTPQTNLFPPWTHGELAICSPSSRCVSVEETESAFSSQHTHHVSKLRKQVRHRLAARQTVQDGDELSELPGGRWKISTASDKPETHTLSNQKDCTDGTNDRGEEDEQDVEAEDEMLFGQRDQPLHLHHHRSKTLTFQNEKVYEPDPTASCTGFTTDFRACQVLWPHENQEELRRQRQSQFLMYRRHFMDTERQQVKEHQRHRKHLKRTARIKNEKEQLRKAEERRMEQQRQQEEERKDMAEREYLILERLRLDEEEEAAEKIERRERTKKIKESKRYIEAMQALMKEKLKKDKVELPPLCCCGDTFWDSNPDTCANNCIFYNNPKAYAQALQSVLLSCELKEGGRGHYSSTWKPYMDVHSHRK